MQMMYTGLANCYIGERTLARSTSNILTAVSLAGLPFAVAEQVPPTLRVTLGFFGMALSVFWLFVNRRMRERINYWIGCLERMEPAEELLIIFRVFTGKDSQTIKKPPRIYAVNLPPWILGFVWAAALTTTSLSLLRSLQ